MRSISIDAYEVGEHCGEQPEFLAEILNNLGEIDHRSEGWLRELVAELNAEGEAALRALVARLDRIDATSTEEDTALVTLLDCPVGLFRSGGELCLKTQYGSNEGRIDAYIVSSGEFFWGSHPQTIENQRKQLVRPVVATSTEGR